MAVNNPYNVKAVSEEEAELMRASIPTCVDLILSCQHDDEVCPGTIGLSTAL